MPHRGGSRRSNAHNQPGKRQREPERTAMLELQHENSFSKNQTHGEVAPPLISTISSRAVVPAFLPRLTMLTAKPHGQLQPFAVYHQKRLGQLISSSFLQLGEVRLTQIPQVTDLCERGSQTYPSARPPGVDDRQQIIDVHQSIARDVGRAFARHAPAIDHGQEIIDIHHVIAARRSDVGGAVSGIGA